MTSMTNPSKAVLLINDSARAIVVVYEDTPGAKREVKKTLDQSVDVDDIVVVPAGTRHGYTTCKVVEVDVDVDFMAPDKIDWVVDVVDLESHQRVLDIEKQALDRIRSAEKRREKDKLREALMADMGPNADPAIAMLAAANVDPDFEPIAPPNSDD